ncbi:hypothetical protein BpHYR1_029442 [Brachionus plicatilis]|uniref:Uncharacterized protein n=1 Tax=Brachionus plicatilis TaxID=10195 RepID=A0A3M7QTA6_BRAPC|nr:hypothetical protein BpHYR1_029442 [Brachionus plicatilis]
MSSYHIVNAIWVGIFPMLAVMILIGILFYFLCCLNQIKNRIVHNRKRRALKRSRLNSVDKRVHDSLDDQDYSSPKPDRSKLFLDLKKDHSQEKKINRKSGSAGDLYMAQPDTPVDCLVVQELSESPKSLYSRMQSLTNLKNVNKPDNQISSVDIQQNENDSSANSWHDNSFNDYDNESSSSSFSKSHEHRKHFRDKIKKKKETKKSKSSNQLRLVNFKKKSGDYHKNNRLSSDIDYGDELFNDDDSLSSTGFSGSQTKSVLMLFKYDTRLPGVRESETGASLSFKDTKRKLIQNSITLNSLNRSRAVNLNSIPKTKSAGFENSKIADSSSLSDMDPDDSLLRDILIKTPKLSAKKNLSF